MRLYESLPSRIDKERDEPTAGSIKAKEAWEAIDPLVRQPATELLTDVLKSKVWYRTHSVLYHTYRPAVD